MYIICRIPEITHISYFTPTRTVNMLHKICAHSTHSIYLHPTAEQESLETRGTRSCSNLLVSFCVIICRVNGGPIQVNNMNKKE